MSKKRLSAIIGMLLLVAYMELGLYVSINDIQLDEFLAVNFLVSLMVAGIGLLVLLATTIVYWSDWK